MTQVIQISVGGAGVNIGSKSIQLAAKEHGIGPDGYFRNDEEYDNTV